MAKPTHKVLHPHLTIMDAVKKPGGVTREQAVAAATAQVETLRDASVGVLLTAIAEIETIVTSWPGEIVPGTKATDVLPAADRIINFAATFGHDRLVEIAKNLCYVAATLASKKAINKAAFRVHTDAMRMMPPFGPGIGAAEESGILAELVRVRAHLEQSAKDG